jgi:hypothetical protein
MRRFLIDWYKVCRKKPGKLATRDKTTSVRPKGTREKKNVMSTIYVQATEKAESLKEKAIDVFDNLLEGDLEAAIYVAAAVFVLCLLYFVSTKMFSTPEPKQDEALHWQPSPETRAFLDQLYSPDPVTA